MALRDAETHPCSQCGHTRHIEFQPCNWRCNRCSHEVRFDLVPVESRELKVNWAKWNRMVFWQRVWCFFGRHHWAEYYGECSTFGISVWKCHDCSKQVMKARL